MKNSGFSIKLLPIFIGAGVLLVTYASSLHSYLLFHSLVEIFSVLVAFVIFVLVWNTRQVLDNHYLLFIGIASLFAGALDLAHLLAYQGLGVFPGYGANLATQLWIAFRYLFSLSFLFAPFFIKRKLNTTGMFSAYFFVTALLLASVFLRWFPACYVEDTGLTLFKIASEYIICLIFLASLGLLLQKRNLFDRGVLRLVILSLLISVASELSFTQYASVYGFANKLGHFFELLSYYLLYRAIVVTGVVEPSILLFRNLKRSEAALRESEARYRSLFENMIDGFAIHKVIVDETGRPVDYIFIEVNNSFERHTGLMRKEIAGKRVREVLPGIENDPADWIGTYGRVAIEGGEIRFEQYSEALKKWFFISAYSPMKEYFVAVFEDITERKRAEEELGKSRELLHSVIEGTSDAIYVKDLNGRYLLFNTASEGITGKKSAEVLGKDDTFLFRPEEAKMVMDGDRTVMKAGTRQTYEEVVTTASGEKRAYLSTKGPLFDNDGRLAGLFGIARDITERKKVQEELQSTHSELERRAYELEAVNRELEAFSYTVSHDLKTPLRSIGGFASALLEDYPDKLDAAGRDCLSRINAAALRMSQLIEAMLKMAKSTRGEIHENVVNLSSLAKVTGHDLKKRDPGRQVEFVIAEKIKTSGDATMMEVMLQNLMENAWKFTSAHQTARIEFGAVERDGTIVYYVRDDGAGFNMKYADKLFMPFQRLHADSEFPGIGIGLAIAHRIITRHGGRMWAEGEVEKGATVFFTLA